jgi:hypothetical protein
VTGGRVAERVVEHAELRLTTDEDRCRCRWLMCDSCSS